MALSISPSLQQRRRQLFVYTRFLSSPRADLLSINWTFTDIKVLIINFQFILLLTYMLSYLSMDLNMSVRQYFNSVCMYMCMCMTFYACMRECVSDSAKDTDSRRSEDCGHCSYWDRLLCVRQVARPVGSCHDTYRHSHFSYNTGHSAPVGPY